MPKIDFARAKLLMDIIVSAGQHGPMYQKLAGLAGDELKAMLEEPKEGLKVVTPAAGPANSAVQDQRTGETTILAPKPQRLDQQDGRIADESPEPGYVQADPVDQPEVERR